VGEELVGPTALVFGAKFFGGGKGFSAPEFFGEGGEGCFVDFNDSDAAAQAVVLVVDFDEVLREVAALVEFGGGEIPVFCEVRGGGFGAVEDLLEEAVVVGITRPELGSFQAWHGLITLFVTSFSCSDKPTAASAPLFINGGSTYGTGGRMKK
jgi:hypothetical protein